MTHYFLLFILLTPYIIYLKTQLIACLIEFVIIKLTQIRMYAKCLIEFVIIKLTQIRMYSK